MKLLTWNINGIRATKDPLKNLLDSLACDISCFQETKITKDQLGSDIAVLDGYSSYYSFSQVRQGYSGVATYCRDNVTPFRAQEGLFKTFEAEAGDGKIGRYGQLESMFTIQRMRELDIEGRTIITQHKFTCSNGKVAMLCIINVYCPRVDPDKPERKQFKLDFIKALGERARALLEAGNSVIVCGDINISHKRIDHCDPDDLEIFYDNPSRKWMDSFLHNTDSLSFEDVKCNRSENYLFVDTFRYFYPKRENAFTCWCTLKGCRQTNYGTRIDYILSDVSFCKRYVTECDIHPEIEGSDHCPVKAELSCIIDSAEKCPPCCTKYLGKFGGKQQKLLQFFSHPGRHPVKTSEIKQENLLMNNSVTVACKRKFAEDNIKRTNKKSSSKQTKLSFFIAKDKPKVDADTKIQSNSQASESPSTCNQTSFKKNTTNASTFWKQLLKGPEPPPLCKGHNEPSVLRTVRKEGPNLGKQFYCCRRPEGKKTDVEARCSYFQWKT